MTTIYGQNPDAHQVAGIAVLFQHVPPTGTDVALPIDTVPSPWRFRYPIFYPLAAAAQLGHLDPITAFPAIAGAAAGLPRCSASVPSPCSASARPAGRDR